MTHVIPDWMAQSAQFTHVLGADECGYGAWAGNLYVCAAAVPSNWSPPSKLKTDSKGLRKPQHEELYYLLRDIVTYAVVTASPQEIDLDGVTSALRRCYREAIQQVLAKHPNSLVIIDGEVKIPGIEHLNFPKADEAVPAVRAASVIGKYLHDQEMVKFAEMYPGYDLAGSAGYGTPRHQAGIAKLGLTPIHRRSYVPTEKKLRTAEEIAANPDEGMILDDT